MYLVNCSDDKFTLDGLCYDETWDQESERGVAAGLWKMMLLSSFVVVRRCVRDMISIHVI